MRVGCGCIPAASSMGQPQCVELSQVIVATTTHCTGSGRAMLEREEYIEQAYFFRALGERLLENVPTQEVLRSIREEILATTKLPMAIDYLLGELRHGGAFAPAMARLGHYFTPFQSYVDSGGGRRTRPLRHADRPGDPHREAQYRADGAAPQGLFLYQFESLCRNRLGYDRGLDSDGRGSGFRRGLAGVDPARAAPGGDPRPGRPDLYPESVLSDRPGPAGAIGGGMCSRCSARRRGGLPLPTAARTRSICSTALHRQLGYPAVPRPQPVDETRDLVPMLARRMERLESRLRLLEEEHRGGIDLNQFYRPPKTESHALTRHILRPWTRRLPVKVTG